MEKIISSPLKFLENVLFYKCKINTQKYGNLYNVWNTWFRKNNLD